MEEFTLGLTGAAAREALLVDGEEKERRWSSARKENDRNRGSRGVKQSWLYSLGNDLFPSFYQPRGRIGYKSE